MTSTIVSFIVFNVINIPVYRFLFRQIFPKKREFQEALRFSFRPDLFSLFKRELREDLTAEMKLGLFLVCCAVLFTAEIQLTQKYLPFLTE